ncbi:hypothetical protein RRG08_006868 [Elysia crispata]|uniref:Uncharacterized protein n=1 Tax=Elysia crispata TaxID=231223 RepID=A0AAE1EB96_9GAST|nr:hypothetical protein RRG08_006868 [Elysia crispata]
MKVDLWIISDSLMLLLLLIYVSANFLASYVHNLLNASPCRRAGEREWAKTAAQPQFAGSMLLGAGGGETYTHDTIVGINQHLANCAVYISINGPANRST